jgi:hypothetical protein
MSAFSYLIGELHLPFGRQKDVYERYMDQHRAGDDRCPCVSKMTFYRVWSERCRFIKVRAFHRCYCLILSFLLLSKFSYITHMDACFFQGLLSAQLAYKFKKSGTGPRLKGQKHSGIKQKNNITMMYVHISVFFQLCYFSFIAST